MKIAILGSFGYLGSAYLRVTPPKELDLLKWPFFSSTSEAHSVMRTPHSSCILDSTKLAALGFPLSEAHESLLLCVKK
jgi:hypothetical protein